MNIIKQFLNLIQGIGLKGDPEGARSVCCNEFVRTEIVGARAGMITGRATYMCENCNKPTKLR